MQTPAQRGGLWGNTLWLLFVEGITHQLKQIVKNLCKIRSIPNGVTTGTQIKQWVFKHKEDKTDVLSVLYIFSIIWHLDLNKGLTSTHSHLLNEHLNQKLRQIPTYKPLSGQSQQPASHVCSPGVVTMWSGLVYS